MTQPCPCGTEIKTTISDDVVWVTEDVLHSAALIGGFPYLLALLDPLYGKAINLHDLCSEIPPAPPAATIAWFMDPLSYLEEIYTAVLRISWNQWCQCTPCPPISGCTGANNFPLTPADGYCHDTEVIGGVEVCVQQEYTLYGGVDVYVSRDSDGTCYGPFNGLVVDWITNTTFDPTLPVHLENYGGGGATGWNGSTYGQDIHVFIGAGGGGAPIWPWDNGGVKVADPIAPPTCDPTTICTAVDYLRDMVSRIMIMQGQSDYFLRGTGGNGTFPLPGTISDANGTLLDVLRQSVTALGPLLPSQLANADTTPVMGSGSVTVTGKQFVEVAFTSIGAAYGSRGATAPVYFSNYRYPGPGWMLVCSDYGVIEYRELVFPQGIQLELPPTATHLLFEIMPDVELNVTTFEREIS